ncbi:MAG: type II toxin-antitoxin system RelE/ParE family toxin [Acidobacteriota bacterium]|nr:type II toxin-antitoxin system RelE/ParE family toxin [Acidobacteriota bacterium]
MYKISIARRAEKDLKRLERDAKNRIVMAISDLKNQPRPLGCGKIQSEAGVWRIRVGDWRVGYFIDDAKQEINIIRIAHRKEFYE